MTKQALSHYMWTSCNLHERFVCHSTRMITTISWSMKDGYLCLITFRRRNLAVKGSDAHSICHSRTRKPFYCISSPSARNERTARARSTTKRGSPKATVAAAALHSTALAGPWHTRTRSAATNVSKGIVDKCGAASSSTYFQIKLASLSLVDCHQAQSTISSPTSLVLLKESHNSAIPVI
eukprot:6183515-Pleurochrysis_carterae.AAC.2